MSLVRRVVSGFVSLVLAAALLVGVGVSSAVAAPGDFVSKWTVTGESQDALTVRLPLVADGYYDFTVDWDDGASELITEASAPVEHEYAAAGTYEVTISGDIKGWNFGEVPNSVRKIVDVTQWGGLQVTNPSELNTDTGGYFRGALNMQVNATDVLNISAVTNMHGMFQSAPGSAVVVGDN